MIDPTDIECAIVAACERRGAARTVCPSEIARTLDAEQWRALMPGVRAAAARLAQRGAIRVTRRGQEVHAEAPGGPIRLGLAEPFTTRRSVPGTP